MSYRIEKIWQTRAGLMAVCAVMEKEHPEKGKFDSHRCGYVAVPYRHKAWGADYGDIAVDVHGGLTYGSHVGGDQSYPTKHTNAWWFGFDCNHSCDSPIQDYYDMKGLFQSGPVRSLEYVINECEGLAHQLMQKDLRIAKYLWMYEGRWRKLRSRMWNATVTLRWMGRWIIGRPLFARRNKSEGH